MHEIKLSVAWPKLAKFILALEMHINWGCTKLRNERNETKYYETQRNILNCETKRNATKWNEYNETKQNILMCETQ
jgi:hypothetical protein